MHRREASLEKHMHLKSIKSYEKSLYMASQSCDSPIATVCKFSKSRENIFSCWNSFFIWWCILIVCQNMILCFRQKRKLYRKVYLSFSIYVECVYICTTKKSKYVCMFAFSKKITETFYFLCTVQRYLFQNSCIWKSWKYY